MFSTRIKARMAALALTGAALTVSGAALAGVVVRSSGPSASQYPVGTKLDDDATITLREDDVITVLTGEGTRIIQGPGRYRVGDRPQVASDRFAALTRKRAASRVRTGAVRTGVEDEPATNPSLWYVDITRSGTICLYDLGTVRLWRPGTEGATTYSIAVEDGDAQVDVTFDDTVMIAALDPVRMPIHESATYSISGPDGAISAQVDFALLSEDYERPDMLAEALIDKGCTVQLEALATTLEASAEQADDDMAQDG